MKTFIVVVLLAVLFTCEADAGSFNLSGSFDPGFTIGRGRLERRHKARAEEVENDLEQEIDNLTSTLEVKHFKIPDVFTQAKSSADEDEPENNEEVTRHHGRARHRVHKH